MTKMKRTTREIEKDLTKIRKAATSAKSMKDIEEATGLSISQITTTLKKHPIIYARIKEQLIANKEGLDTHESKDISSKETSAPQRKVKIAVIASSEESKDEVRQDNSKAEKDLEYVIDASITGIEQLKDILAKIYSSGKKIILTSITIKELEKMQKFNDDEGNDARYILTLAADKPEAFKTVLIDETLDTPDDCIIKYCADNNQNVVLMTSDKTMSLKARMYSVQVEFYKQPIRIKNKDTKPIIRNNSKTRTLIPAKRIDGKLVLMLSELQSQKLSIVVYSDGIEYTTGVKELKIGDDVYIASEKSNYFTFSHYRMTSLYLENNCQIIYSARIYNNVDLNRITNASYKAFLKQFKSKICC